MPVFERETAAGYFAPMGTLKELRLAAGLTQYQLAELAGTSQPQIRRLEAGQRPLTKAWAERLAPHLHASAKSLMFNEEQEKAVREVVGLPVLGTSRAGEWLDITIPDESDTPIIGAPMDTRFPHARQYALLVAGDSMNELFPAGSYVTCADFAGTGLSFRPGMIVHVERTMAGTHLVETTLKEIAAMPGGGWELRPRSTNPAHRSIPIDGNESTEILVRGVVLGKWEQIEV